VDDRGEIVSGPVADETGVLSRVLPNPEQAEGWMLAYVDHYGDTLFNSGQASRVIKEIDEVLASQILGDEHDRALLLRLRDMARECSETAHVFLKIIGD
jgi:hypothetical protein